jgi:SAM-dependent methyltransferase
MKAESTEDSWELRYQTGETPWEKGYAAPPLIEWLGRNQPLEGRILVPGCGSGHDVRALARAGGDDCEIVGLDIAPSAIRAAQALTSALNITFQRGNLLNLPADWLASFDWVFEHTCFCALVRAERRAYVKSVASVLKPSGKFLAIFFLTPWDPDEDPLNSGPPFGTDRAELEELFEGQLPLISEYVPRQSYPERAGRELVQLRWRAGCDRYQP